MHHLSLAVVLLLLSGELGTVFAGPDDLYSAEWSERNLEKNPRDEVAWAGLVEARLKDKDFARAEKALADWKSKVPKPSANLDRLRGELALARDAIPDAIDAWLRYLKAEPKDWETRVQLSVAYSRQRAWKEAVRELSNVIEGNPHAAAYSQRAACRIRLHDWPGAESDVREANHLDATESVVRSLLPRFERARDWLPAVKKLDSAITKEPDNISLLLDRAEWLFGAGFLDAGLDDVQAALKTNPKSLRAQIWNGAVAWERGDVRSAGDVLELRFGDFGKEFRTGLKSIDASTDPEARARFLLSHKQPLLALSEVRNADGSPAKAHALLELGRSPEAGVAARRAAELHPDDPEAWLVLGRLELHNGNIGEALEALNRSTKIKRSSEAEALRTTAMQRLGKK
jgi:tetratricopeptide (TPR) repeat protein